MEMEMESDEEEEYVAREVAGEQGGLKCGTVHMPVSVSGAKLQPSGKMLRETTVRCVYAQV